MSKMPTGKGKDLEWRRSGVEIADGVETVEYCAELPLGSIPAAADAVKAMAGYECQTVLVAARKYERGKKIEYAVSGWLAFRRGEEEKAVWVHSERMKSLKDAQMSAEWEMSK